MKITEVFKSKTEEERREAVTAALMKYEADKRKNAEARKPLKAG